MKYIVIITTLLLTTSVFGKMDFEKRGRWINALPLGVGQYQNYEYGKALTRMIGESLLLGTALGAAVYSQVDQENKTIQKVELYSFLGFLLFYSWGTYDAFSNYDKADKYIIQQLKQRVMLVPNATKNGLGLDLLVRF